MAEVRYEKRGYCRYKSMESCLGIGLNLMFGFVLGLFAFSAELNGSMWRWFMVLYAVGSVVYAGYAMPKYLLTLRWVLERPEKEMVELELVNPGTVLINGFEWDATYWNKADIVVDCETGIAHLPYMNTLKEVLK